MDTITKIIAVPLGYAMQWCHFVFSNYGLAIIFFTFLTKIILMPLSVWVQKNSIKMVKMQPEINKIKAKFFGDPDTIADHQSALFKKFKYNPLASLIPLCAQLILLMGVVAVIYHPFEYLFHFSADTISAINNAASKVSGVSLSDNSIELVAIDAIKTGKLLPLSSVDASVINSLKDFDLMFLGVNLSFNPSVVLGVTIFVPIIAGLSSFVLSFAQNKSNVLQAEQSKANQYGLLAFSVALSLYLGFFVPAGIALYWVSSNLLAIVQLYFLNAVIPPKKYVDYEALESSRKELEKLNALAKSDKKFKNDENAKREKADYKRFFSIANKHIVFYSERSGFYKYYQEIIDYLLAKSNLSIHYVTNDPQDIVFEISKQQPRIKPYYIGVKKLIPLMMKMDADVVVMTTPDLDNFYIKRSLVRKDIEYIFVPHDPSSMHMGFREHSLDNFDTVFCTGPHIAKEVRASEKYYGTHEKNLVEFGYPLIEKLVASYEAQNEKSDDTKQILIAPSWQEDNLLDSVLDPLLDSLCQKGYKIIVRPHPEYMKRYKEKMDAIVEKHAGKGIVFELDFSSNASVYSSDILITDWSGIGIEFGFATLKPVIFVNTKIKMENPNYNVINIEPQEIRLRNVLGKAIDKDLVSDISSVVEELLASDSFAESAKENRENYFYNFGSNGSFGGKYILKTFTKGGERK